MFQTPAGYFIAGIALLVIGGRILHTGLSSPPMSAVRIIAAVAAFVMVAFAALFLMSTFM